MVRSNLNHQKFRSIQFINALKHNDLLTNKISLKLYKLVK